MYLDIISFLMFYPVYIYLSLLISPDDVIYDIVPFQPKFIDFSIFTEQLD